MAANQRIDKCRLHARDQADALAGDASRDGSAARAIGWSVQHQQDVRTAEDLIAEPSTFDSTRRWLLSVLGWLNAHPGRTFVPAVRQRVEGIEKAQLAAARTGHSLTVDEWKATRPPARRRPRAPRRRDGWPSWLRGDGAPAVVKIPR